MASVDDAKRAWTRSYEGFGQEEIGQRILGFAALSSTAPPKATRRPPSNLLVTETLCRIERSARTTPATYGERSNE